VGDAIEWLLAGDPVIRWQTMRDLADLPAADWSAERARVGEEGWGAQFVAHLRPDGTWPAGRWTDTVWTLLTLIDCGIPPDHPGVSRAARQFIDRNLTPERAASEKWLLTRMDLCHLGFWLRIGSYFLGVDERLARTTQTVLRVQMPDGGWNCHIRNKPATEHSSFHTTFNVLEGLSLAADVGNLAGNDFRASEARALEFMLRHRMYRSDRTGQIISERFTQLTFPSHWHYTVVRGLDYMRERREIGDSRLADPIGMLEGQRKASGRWPLGPRIPGTTLFDMERGRGDSRWNTLRVLRVLRSRRRAIRSEL
jgi:hypothetical protein